MLLRCVCGLFLICEDYWVRLMNHSPTVRVFFPLVEISVHTPGPLFQAKNQSTMAQWDDMTVDEWFLMSCMWAHFPYGFPHKPGQHSPLWLPSVKGACMLSCNLPPALMAEWPGFSFSCYCGNMGMEHIAKCKSPQKANYREENWPAALSGDHTCNLRIMSPALSCIQGDIAV